MARHRTRTEKPFGLLQLCRSSREAGDLDGAIAKIQGALVVDPNNATLKEIISRLLDVKRRQAPTVQ